MENPFFLKKKYGDLHTAPEVEQAAHRKEKRTGEKVPQDPAVRIQNYLNRFKEITDRTNPEDRERGVEAIKRLLYRSAVIKPENIPESYWDTQRRLAREQGHGDIEITDHIRAQQAEIIITDQKSSLDTWVDYFASPDATYPDWLKYWATRSILSMGEYDKQKKAFTKRTKGTVKPFPDINREALAYVLDAIEKKYEKQQINVDVLDQENRAKFEQLLKDENFAKLYAFAIERVTPTEGKLLETTAGEWIKYPRNSDHMPLVESLQSHGTGWCTAGESTAEAQLKGGDFYVYYSLDEQGKPRIPRAAIRMQGDAIAEVRGIADDQNLDPYIGDVVQKKMKDFPDGKAYEKKAADMKRLTVIEKKTKANETLTKEELALLYEIEAPIQGFGYEKDPRIKEIIAGRNTREDLSRATGFKPDQISLTRTEALTGRVRYHYGSLDLSYRTTAEGLKLPESIGGDLYLPSLSSVEGLKLPESVGGDLALYALISAQGLKFPEFVGGGLYLNMLSLNTLSSAQGIKLPESIGRDLNLSSLASAQGLKFPESIGGSLTLSNLASAEGLKLPESIGGDLNLSILTSAQGLKLPESIGGGLYLNSLTSVQGLKFPESIGGGLYLNNLPKSERERLRKERPDLNIFF